MRLTAGVLLGVLFATGGALGQINVGRTGFGGRTVAIGQKKPDQKSIHENAAARCRYHIRLAREYFSAGRWGSCRESLDLARSVAVEVSLARQVRELYVKLNHKGEELLDAAETLYNEEKYLEALKAYGRISRQFGSLPAGVSAAGALRRAKNDSRVRAYFREAGAQVMAEYADRMIARALEAQARAEGASARSQPTSAPKKLPVGRLARIRSLPLDRRIEIFSIMENIVRLYGGAPTARKVRADLNELKKDKKFVEAMKRRRREDDLRQAYKLAEMYEKNGMRKKAIAHYRDIVRRYPRSEQAAKARARLKLLSGG